MVPCSIGVIIIIRNVNFPSFSHVLASATHVPTRRRMTFELTKADCSNYILINYCCSEMTLCLSRNDFVFREMTL